jgi:hypothetical protein
VSLENPQNSSVLVRAVLIVPSEARVLQDFINRVSGAATIVYQRKRGPWRISRKLDSEDGGERLGGARSIAPLARGEGLWVSMGVTRLWCFALA